MKLGQGGGDRFGPDAPPAERKSFLIYYARVMLREARARRGQNVRWMLRGAERARREAAAISLAPTQADLFAMERGG